MYIHKQCCIAPQPITNDGWPEAITPSVEGKMVAIEPVLEGVPAGMLRRMSKAVRMGIGAGLPLIKDTIPNGIIIGTANGGMEDCIKFLNQIIDYDEGMLTPGNFVQSTPNAIAGQLSLIKKNHNYNATHVHLGLAFENALIDAKMFLNRYPANTYLAGAVDEISTYNYNIDRLAGWYDPKLNNKDLYTSAHTGTLAGEGAALFLLNGAKKDALAKITAIETLHTTDPQLVTARLDSLLKEWPPAENTILLSGENGDTRFSPFYDAVEAQCALMPVLRFKHLTGEYPTVISFAVWLAANWVRNHKPAAPLLKKGVLPETIDQVLIYNNYHGRQHSFMLVSKPH